MGPIPGTKHLWLTSVDCVLEWRIFKRRILNGVRSHHVSGAGRPVHSPLSSVVLLIVVVVPTPVRAPPQAMSPEVLVQSAALRRRRRRRQPRPFPVRRWRHRRRTSGPTCRRQQRPLPVGRWRHGRQAGAGVESPRGGGGRWWRHAAERAQDAVAGGGAVQRTISELHRNHHRRHRIVHYQ